MRKGTPNQLIAELTNKIEELKGEDINSSAIIVDTDEDVITADEQIDEFIPEEEFEDIEEPEVEETSVDYLDKLYEDVEKELEDEITGISWASDDENVYMDANFFNGHVLTFTIPKEDLEFNIDGIDKDVEYICVAVRDSQEPDEEEFVEEFEDAPVYL